MNNQMIEKVARELCKLDIRNKRRWDTTPALLEENLPAAVDYAWHDYAEQAAVALSAYNPDERLREALVTAQGAIASLDADALGRDNMRGWSYRDELLAQIDRALSPLPQGDDT